MRSRAAVLHGVNEPFSVEEIEVDAPRSGEVLVKMSVAGICHSDYHIASGSSGFTKWPIVAGHEGAGVVAALGPGVTSVEVGAHVVLAGIPSCGRCRWCTTGATYLCVRGRASTDGFQLDRTARMHTSDGTDIRQFVFVSTFSEYTVVPEACAVPVPREIPTDRAAILGCAVVTGWGAAVHKARIEPGETVVVIGAGGVGLNAAQGAAMKSPRHVIAVDINDDKLAAAKVFGATHCVNPSRTDLVTEIMSITEGGSADAVIVTTSHSDQLGLAVDCVGRRGRVVMVSLAQPGRSQVSMDVSSMVLLEKELIGCFYGSANPHHDLALLARMYADGVLKLDELISHTYTLEDINVGFEDMLAGRSIRGLVRF